MKNNENKTELAIPSAGEDAETQGFSFIANVNANDTVTLKDSLSFINHFLNLNIGSLDFQHLYSWAFIHLLWKSV